MQVQADPTATTIVIGEGTEEMHLNTFEDLECVSCTRPFFSGQSLAESPVYALVTEYKVIQDDFTGFLELTAQIQANPSWGLRVYTLYRLLRRLR